MFTECLWYYQAYTIQMKEKKNHDLISEQTQHDNGKANNVMSTLQFKGQPVI